MHIVKDPQGYIDSLPYHVLLRAKLLSSHMILPDNALVLDIGCGQGDMTAALAALNPYLRFIGIDRQKASVQVANDRFDFDNLSFICGDITQEKVIADQTADAIVNSCILGEIYTRTGYNIDKVQKAMAYQFTALKQDGFYILYDYVMQDEEKFVLIEFPVMKGSFKTRSQLKGENKIYQGERDCEMLKWFSENARAARGQNDMFRGFFIEELPAKRPFTRLFRLPHKWAYEFILRIGEDDSGKCPPMHEYTCMTVDDYVRVAGHNCARLVYTRPWRDPKKVRDVYKNRFRLYRDDVDMTKMDFPDMGFVMVAQKTGEGRSLKIRERRPSTQEAHNVLVHTLKDEHTGQLIDLAARAYHEVTIIPYVVDSLDNRVHIALKKGPYLSLSNTVLRSGHNIDNRRWSGHGLASLALKQDVFDMVDATKPYNVARLMQEYFGMRVEKGTEFLMGPKGFPAPDLIENYIETLYVALDPKQDEWHKDYVLVDAERILRAINGGYIPDAWLEVQLEALYSHCGLIREPWMHEELPVGDVPPPEDRILKVQDIFGYDSSAGETKPEKDEEDKEEQADGRFRDVKGKAGQLRAVRSVFVGEGRQQGTNAGVSSSELDFIVPQDGIVNRAAILPLTADLKGNVLAGFELEQMPAPYRLGMKDKMINLPCITLPKHVDTIDAAKQFIAETFETDADRVAQMGESFFTMRDISPQRIYPFAVASAPCVWMGDRDIFYAPIKELWMLEADFTWSMLYTYGSGYMRQSLSNSVHNPGYSPRLDREGQRFGQLKSSSSRSRGESVSVDTHRKWFKRGMGNDNANPEFKSVSPLRPLSYPAQRHG